MRILLTILFVLCGQVVLSCAAIADYIVPPVAEDYTLIPDSWKLTKTSLLGDFDRLEVIHKGKTYVWTIDRFLLADRTDSNTICCGTYMNFTRNYLEKISKAQPNGVVRVEVVTAQKAGELKVAGIWLVDFKQSWDRAIQ